MHQIIQRVTRQAGAAGLSVFLVLAAAGPGMAQQSPPPRSLYQQVIPRPTGRNGYEELVLACDRLNACPAFTEASAMATPLSELKTLLADRRVTEALSYLRTGLNKPIASPRELITVATPTPEVTEFRKLARLLRIQQRVLISEGRNAELIASFRTGIRLSRAVQVETLAAGEMGIEILTMQAQSVGDWLEQLSAKDCEQLSQICIEELRQPDPTPTLLAGENRFVKASIAQLSDAVTRKGVAGLQEALGLTDDQIKPAAPFIQGLATNPQALAALATQLAQGADEVHRREMEELRKPLHQRTPIDPSAYANANPIVSYTIQQLLPEMSHTLEALALRDVYLRMIACHCAIRRYRWEHNRLPQNLDELRLSELAVDPYSGEPFQYVVKRKQYVLLSAGQRSRPNDPRAVNGRTPVLIGPDELP